MHKVIFLDIDGVLNCATTKTKVPYYGFRGVENKFVKRLRKIVDATNAEIILSSTWKDGWLPEYKDCKGWIKHLWKKLEQEDMSISGVTRMEERWTERGSTIDEYIHEFTPDEYVVIDDEYFKDFAKYNLGAHFVHTLSFDGLTDENVEQAIRILNGHLREETEEEIAEVSWKEEHESTRKLAKMLEEEEKQK